MLNQEPSILCGCEVLTYFLVLLSFISSGESLRIIDFGCEKHPLATCLVCRLCSSLSLSSGFIVVFLVCGLFYPGVYCSRLCDADGRYLEVFLDYVSFLIFFLLTERDHFLHLLY